MTRYVVVGTSGSGKTTLARQIALRLEIPHIELDALHWQPGWVGATPEAMRKRVETAIAAPAWVLDGNYSKVRDVVWQRATHLIWLDYSFPLVFWRIFSPHSASGDQPGRTLERQPRESAFDVQSGEHSGLGSANLLAASAGIPRTDRPSRV